MESAYSVTRLSIAYMIAAHERTHTHTHKHTHTPQSMITHQGFRVESWAITYRCYICRSLGLVLNDPSVHPFSWAKTVACNPQTTCVQRCTDTDATSTRCSQPGYRVIKLTHSLPLIRVKQNPTIISRLMFQWGAKVMP